MQNTKQNEIPTVNQLIRIKNKDLPLAFFHIEYEDSGLELINYYPIGGKIIDGTFKIVDLHKYMLFLIKYPVKIYSVNELL
jgi:hypothetical protein